MVYVDTNDSASGMYVSTQDNSWQNISFPKGAMVMWNPASGPVPTGWLVCDGTNGTPNFTGAKLTPNLPVTMIIKV